MDSSLDFAPVVAPSKFDPHSARPIHTLTEVPLGSVIGSGERAAARPYPSDLLARSLRATGGGAADGTPPDQAGTAAAGRDEAGSAAAAGDIPPDVAARIAAVGELAQDLKAKGEALRRLEDEQRALQANLETLLGVPKDQRTKAKAGRVPAETDDERTAQALSLLSSGEPPARQAGQPRLNHTWS